MKLQVTPTCYWEYLNMILIWYVVNLKFDILSQPITVVSDCLVSSGRYITDGTNMWVSRIDKQKRNLTETTAPKINVYRHWTALLSFGKQHRKWKILHLLHVYLYIYLCIKVQTWLFLVIFNFVNMFLKW